MNSLDWENSQSNKICLNVGNNWRPVGCHVLNPNYVDRWWSWGSPKASPEICPWQICKTWRQPGGLLGALLIIGDGQKGAAFYHESWDQVLLTRTQQSSVNLQTIHCCQQEIDYFSYISCRFFGCLDMAWPWFALGVWRDKGLLVPHTLRRTMDWPCWLW